MAHHALVHADWFGALIGGVVIPMIFCSAMLAMFWFEARHARH